MGWAARLAMGHIDLGHVEKWNEVFQIFFATDFELESKEKIQIKFKQA
jgi:hypothetical protein